MAAQLAQQLDHRVDVAEPRHALERGLALGHQAGRQDRQGAVLAAGDLDFALEAIAAADEKAVHFGPSLARGPPRVLGTPEGTCSRGTCRVPRTRGCIGQSIGRRSQLPDSRVSDLGPNIVPSFRKIARGFSRRTPRPQESQNWH